MRRDTISLRPSPTFVRQSSCAWKFAERTTWRRSSRPPGLIAREIQECLEDRAAEGLPLTIETQQVDVEVEVAA